MSKLEKFNQLKAKNTFKDDKELLDFFDTLDPITIEETLGIWKGGDFDTGHWGTPALKGMKWFGKRFNSAFEGMPLLCFNEAGHLFSNTIMNGESSLWMIEFRNKVSTTMVYDGVPIFDHFRKVDDNTIMGIMNGKEAPGFPPVVQDGHYYYFYLERISELPVPFDENNSYMIGKIKKC